MVQPSDLIRIADLIKLGAETAKIFSDTTVNGQRSKVTEVADRILAASEELAAIGREMAASGSPLKPAP